MEEKEDEGFLLLEDDQNSKPLLQNEETGQILNFWGKPVLHESSLGGWRAALFFLGSNVLQSMAIYGSTINLVIFLVQVLHLDNADSANILTTWLGTTFISSIVGGCLGDAYLGRLWSSVLCQILYVVGSVLFAISAHTLSAHNTGPCMDGPNCETSQTPPQTSLFYTGLYLMGLATALMAPNLISLGADQFDSQAQKSTFINVYTASGSVGMLVATTLISYIQNEGHWAMGFWISTGAGILGFILFLGGVPCTRQFTPGKNPLVTISSVILAAARNYETKKHSNNHNSEKFELRWLDNAAKSGDGSSCSSCTLEEVEEVKSLCRLFPFWLCGVFMSAALAQKATFFVLQGTTMDNRVMDVFHFPPSSMGLFSILTVAIGAPLYSLFIMPCIQRFKHDKGEVSSIDRMGIGLVFAMAVFAIAAIVESQRLRIAHKQAWVETSADHDHIVPMSIFWLIPQYVFEGWTMVFFACGHMDFNYSFSPKSMRSLATAISITSFAIGNYISSIIVKVVTSLTSWIPNDLNHGHLDYFYWLLVLLIFLNFLIFVVFSKFHIRQLQIETNRSNPHPSEKLEMEP